MGKGTLPPPPPGCLGSLGRGDGQRVLCVCPPPHLMDPDVRAGADKGEGFRVVGRGGDVLGGAGGDLGGTRSPGKVFGGVWSAIWGASVVPGGILGIWGGQEVLERFSGVLEGNLGGLQWS